MMNSKASSIRPPSHPWSVPLVSQSTSSCSEREINFPVESFVIPSIAATAENAQQHPAFEQISGVTTPLLLQSKLDGTAVTFSYWKGLGADGLGVRGILYPL